MPQIIVIQHQTQVKKLHDLHFEIHIKGIVQTAMQMSGWIFRTFRSRDAVTMKMLLQSLLSSPNLNMLA